jgi:hypothetical protein
MNADSMCWTRFGGVLRRNLTLERSVILDYVSRLVMARGNHQYSVAHEVEKDTPRRKNSCLTRLLELLLNLLEHRDNLLWMGAVCQNVDRPGNSIHAVRLNENLKVGQSAIGLPELA